MEYLERIIGSNKYRSLNILERSRINDLLVANPVYVHLVAGILDQSDWRRVLGAAYIKYVGSTKTVGAKKSSPEKNTQMDVIFGVGDTGEFTKTRVVL